MSTAHTMASVASAREVEPGIRSDLRAVKIVLARELIRFRQDRTRMLSAVLQPILYLFVLGTGLSTLTGRSTGGLSLRTFMFPGVLATSTLFTAVFSAMSIVWDREFGFLREMLVAPVRRGSIITGKALAGGVVATAQGLLVIVLGPFVHVPTYRPLFLVSLLVELFVISFTLTSAGLVMAARVKQMQAMMGIMNMVILPLSFLSGALYPAHRLPKWMSVIVHANPLTYAVHAVRTTVFAQIDVPAPAREALNPSMAWFGWDVTVWAGMLLMAVIGLLLLSLAIWQFRQSE